MDIEAIPLLCVAAADFFPVSYHHVFPSAGISVHPTDIPAGAPGDLQQCPGRDRAQSVRRALQRPLLHVWISFCRSSAGLWSVSALLKRYINFQSVGESFCSLLTIHNFYCTHGKKETINELHVPYGDVFKSTFFFRAPWCMTLDDESLGNVGKSG